VLLPILLLRSFRHLGLMFLVPAATYPGIPQHLPILLLSAICLRLCWLLEKVRLWGTMAACSTCGSSTYREHWIRSQP
jgi:hypothetical protein